MVTERPEDTAAAPLSSQTFDSADAVTAVLVKSNEAVVTGHVV
jgi:hypothetical protein